MNLQDAKFEITKVDAERRIGGDVRIEAVELSTRYVLKVKLKASDMTNEEVRDALLVEFEKELSLNKDIEYRKSQISIGTIL